MISAITCLCCFPYLECDVVYGLMALRLFRKQSAYGIVSRLFVEVPYNLFFFWQTSLKVELQQDIKRNAKIKG